MLDRRMWLTVVIVSATAAVVVGVTVAYLVQKDGNPLYIRGVGFLSVGTLTVVAVSFAAIASVAGFAARRQR
jgi:hypothetical protein